MSARQLSRARAQLGMPTAFRFGNTRRTLLRGLGRGAVLLASIARTRLSFAQQRRGNLLIYFTPNGFNRSQYGGSGDGASFSLLPSLAPLLPHKADVAVIKGVSNKSTSIVPSHTEGHRVLTCTGDETRDMAFGPSFDEVIANHFGQRPLNLVAKPCPTRGPGITISWQAAGAVNPLLDDPKAAYAKVFGGVVTPATGQQTAAVDDVLRRKRSVLDFIRQDLSLFRGRLGAADRRLVDLHLESLRELEKDLTVPTLPPVGQACDSARAKTETDAAAVQSTSAETLKVYGKAMLSLTAAAFGCGLRRSATLAWGPGAQGTNPVGMVAGTHHDITHDATWSQTLRPLIDRWYAERLAEHLAALRSRGLLDDTVVVWISEIVEAHRQCNYTLVVAGGRGLGLKTGKAIEYPYFGKEADLLAGVMTSRDPRNRSVADLWVSIQKALGRQRDAFGDPQYCTGGLQELYAG